MNNLRRIDTPATDDTTLIEIMMAEYARGENITAALRGVLLRIFAGLDARRGGFFIYREVDHALECIYSHNDGDAATGCIIPLDGDGTLAARVFRNGTEAVIKDGRLHHIAVPVQLGQRRYGVLVMTTQNASAASPARLVRLGTALALGIANLQLLEKSVRARLGRHRMDEITETRAALTPPLDHEGYIAAKILPSRRLAGDFFDYIRIAGRIFFCQGHIPENETGRRHGIRTALLMARVVTIFRNAARGSAARNSNADTASIHRAIHDELRTANKNRDTIALVLGLLDTQTGMAEVLNCGYSPVILVEEGGDAAPIITPIPSHISARDPRSALRASLSRDTPITDTWQGNLTRAALYIGLAPHEKIIARHGGMSAAARLADLTRRHAKNNPPKPEYDAIMVVTAMGRDGHHE